MSEGDAGQDYAPIVSGDLSILRTRPLAASKESFQLLFSQTAAALAQNSGGVRGALALGLRKKRMTLMGTRFSLGSEKDVLQYDEAALGFFVPAQQWLNGQAGAARASGDWAEAVRRRQAQTLLGWQMLQDWDFTTQFVGATVVVGGVMGEVADKNRLPADAKT